MNNIQLIILFIFIVLNFVCVIIRVAFLTLIERKVLAYVQFRKGPNKVGYLGIFQPFSDAVKLFIKELNLPTSSNVVIFLFSPFFIFFVSFILWLLISVNSDIFLLKFGLLYFLCCLSLGVYGTLFSGWSSNSKYSLLGALRSVAQTISYEISLVLIILSFIYVYNTCNFSYFKELSSIFYSFYFFIFLFFIFFCSILAELNRTPFDFTEGESELVSGFNVEYSSYRFALIFLSEYSNIIFISFIIVLFFFRRIWNLIFRIKLFFFIFLIIIIRGLLPRYRYDKLIYLCWKVILPISLLLFYEFYFLKNIM